jgi:hypothetical protein
MLNKFDVYTVMLGVSLMAVLVGVLLLALELSRYSKTAMTPVAQPTAVVQTINRASLHYATMDCSQLYQA